MPAETMQSKTRSQQKAGPQQIPVAALAVDTWLGRALYYDVLAIAVNLLSATAVALDLYAAGYGRATTGVSPAASFAPLTRIALEGAIFVTTFVWMASRLVRSSYREIPRARRP